MATMLSGAGWRRTAEHICAAIGGVAALAIAIPAAAAPRSIVTTVTLDACEQSGNVEDGGIWTCKGLSELPVMIAEGDLRQYVSFGADAANEPAAHQTLPSFNSIFAVDSQQAEIRWRVDGVDGKDVPFAAILRYFTEAESADGPARQGEVLVVARIDPSRPGGNCHVGYVDALANADALALAEKLADDNARGFDCAKGEATPVGATGKSPMLGEE